MKIIRKIDDYKNYYSIYDLNTFFTIDAMKEQIPRNDINLHLLNAAIFYCTNLERAKLNISICRFHEKLLETAMLHSLQMKIYNFFNHQNAFNTRYKTLIERINSVKDNSFQGFICYGENIADYPIIKANEKFTIENRNGIQHFFSRNGKEILHYSYYEFAKIVVEGWMNSPGHRKNILNPNFTYLGCGCAKYEKQSNGYSMLYFKLTQNFGGTLQASSFPLGIKKIIKYIKK
jgi:uncharacterized protein YkwD